MKAVLKFVDVDDFSKTNRNQWRFKDQSTIQRTALSLNMTPLKSNDIMLKAL